MKANTAPRGMRAATKITAGRAGAVKAAVHTKGDEDGKDVKDMKKARVAKEAKGSKRVNDVPAGTNAPGAIRASDARAQSADGAPAAGADPGSSARATDSDAVLKQFRVIFRSVKKHFQVIERSCGIGGSQLWALATIVNRPGIRVSELAVALSVHQSTASNLIEQMVRLGMIVRERDNEDQRVVRLSATPRGAALLARAPQPLTGVLPDALSHLDSAALAQLREALDRLLTVMQVRDESASHTPLADI